MGLDQEAIKKRFSQIELDINNMNRIIDDNLQINEVEKEDIKDMKESSQSEEPTYEVKKDENILSPQKFSEVTAQAADAFVNNAGVAQKKEPCKDNKEIEKNLEDNLATERKYETEEVEMPTNIEVLTKEKVEIIEPHRVVKVEEKHSLKAAIGTDSKAEVKNEISSVLPVVSVPREMEESPKDSSATFDNHAIDQSTDTSEDFAAVNGTSATSYPSSFSSPVEPITPIFLPKNNSEDQNKTDKETIPCTTTSLRRPTNPFRVVSVGTTNGDGTSSRKSSREIPDDASNVTEVDGASKSQKRLDYLAKKCLKLQKEIKYLRDMNSQNTLSIEDGRRLSNAIDKLQEYLDRKTKEKYELGVLLSRQLRKEIDRGENGQFWIGTK